MRIVSQDRVYDIPYEKLCLDIVYAKNYNEIIAYSADAETLSWVLGTYETKERANEVMELIRYAYTEFKIAEVTKILCEKYLYFYMP